MFIAIPFWVLYIHACISPIDRNKSMQGFKKEKLILPMLTNFLLRFSTEYKGWSYLSESGSSVLIMWGSRKPSCLKVLFRRSTSRDAESRSLGKIPKYVFLMSIITGLQRQPFSLGIVKYVSEFHLSWEIFTGFAITFRSSDFLLG